MNFPHEDACVAESPVGVHCRQAANYVRCNYAARLRGLSFYESLTSVAAPPGLIGTIYDEGAATECRPYNLIQTIAATESMFRDPATPSSLPNRDT